MCGMNPDRDKLYEKITTPLRGGEKRSREALASHIPDNPNIAASAWDPLSRSKLPSKRSVLSQGEAAKPANKGNSLLSYGKSELGA